MSGRSKAPGAKKSKAPTAKPKSQRLVFHNYDGALFAGDGPTATALRSTKSYEVYSSMMKAHGAKEPTVVEISPDVWHGRGPKGALDKALRQKGRQLTGKERTALKQNARASDMDWADRKATWARATRTLKKGGGTRRRRKTARRRKRRTGRRRR